MPSLGTVQPITQQLLVQAIAIVEHVAGVIEPSKLLLEIYRNFQCGVEVRLMFMLETCFKAEIYYRRC